MPRVTRSLFQCEEKFECRYRIRIALDCTDSAAFLFRLEINEKSTSAAKKEEQETKAMSAKKYATWGETRVIPQISDTYRKPQGSYSAIRKTSVATRGKRSAGKSTSPHASCADFAALSSSSRRLVSAWHAVLSKSAVSSLIK